MIRVIRAFVFFLISVTAQASGLGVPIQEEETRIKILIEEEKATAKDRERLAEIYFYTSRCSEVAKVLKDGEGVAVRCACTKECAAKSSPLVSAYWKIKELYQLPIPHDKKAIQQRRNLERKLENLEVH